MRTLRDVLAASPKEHERAVPAATLSASPTADFAKAAAHLACPCGFQAAARGAGGATPTVCTKPLIHGQDNDDDTLI